MRICELNQKFSSFSAFVLFFKKGYRFIVVAVSRPVPTSFADLDPKFPALHTVQSTVMISPTPHIQTDPSFECVCQLGTRMKDDGSACIAPPPTLPTPRPIPTLPPAQKVVANVVTRTASTTLIGFTAVTVGLFLLLGIIDPSRY